MKILFLCNNLNIGGIETYLLRYIRWHFAAFRNDEIHINCKSGYGGQLEKEYLLAGAVIHKCRLGYFNPLDYLKFYYLLDRYRFSAICDFSGDFSALSLLSAKFFGVPSRIAFYRVSRNSYNANLLKMIYQYVINLIIPLVSTAILSNSKESLKYHFRYHKLSKKAFTLVIPNGVFMESLHSIIDKQSIRSKIGVPKGNSMVIHVGRCVKEKNHNMMIELAELSKEYGYNISFVFIGNDVKLKLSKHIIERQTNNVILLNIRNDIAELLCSADVFLFPSLSEGQPNALIEAIQVGLPFVASNIPSIKEVLPSDWNDQWLLEPNDPQKYLDMIQDHLRNKKERQIISHKLANWSKINYDPQRCFSMFSNILRNPDYHQSSATFN